MAMFDIDTLLNFRPPRYMCQKCCALNLPKFSPFSDTEPVVCEVCKVEYVPTNECNRSQLLDYFSRVAGTAFTFKEPLQHCQTLATYARMIRQRDSRHWPPLKSLLQLFLQAKKFIHFTTFGISETFVGALKVISQRVSVRGIVSNPGDRVISELTEFESEAPNLYVHMFKADRLQDVPHHKLIVVDGLLAIKGSPNLTTFAWRKIEKGFEIADVVTDVEEVMHLHNQYFSPIWGERSDKGDQIEMDMSWAVPE
jgi:phosphatidylserine/phosphatidylglycerophosphate/cardiolipin synthase-like enzyme